MTRDQKQILHILNVNGGTVTTEQVAAAIGTTPHNGGKYISERLSRMVKQGILRRVKPGAFEAKIEDKGLFDE